MPTYCSKSKAEHTFCPAMNCYVLFDPAKNGRWLVRQELCDNRTIWWFSWCCRSGAVCGVGVVQFRHVELVAKSHREAIEEAVKSYDWVSDKNHCP